MPPAPGPHSGALLFRHRDFSLFWIGVVLASLGTQIEAVTIGWQIYSLARTTLSIDRSAFLVGMVGLAQFLPLCLLTLYAGSLADRHDRRLIAVCAISVQALGDLVLVGLALRPEAGMAGIFAVAAVFGAARAFLSPAATALVPMMVARADMPRAISLRSLAWQGSVICGPMIGGLLCAISPALSYAVTALFYAAAAGTLYLIRANTKPVRQGGGRLAQIREGLEYIWANQIVFGAISLDLCAGLLAGATALLPAFASDILHVGPHGFGLLRSAPAVGAVLMALALARWPLQRRAGPRMFWAVATFGAVTVVFALSRVVWLSVLALVVLGATDMISVYVRQTLVQIVTPDHMRGRVSAVSGLFIAGSNELGEFESGVVARILGPVGAAIFGGIGTIGVTGLWSRLFPDLRRADALVVAEPMPAPPRNDPAEPAPEAAAGEPQVPVRSG